MPRARLAAVPPPARPAVRPARRSPVSYTHLFLLLLIGYALAMTVLVMTRRSTPPPQTVVVNQEPPVQAPGCGAFLLFVGLIFVALVFGAMMG